MFLKACSNMSGGDGKCGGDAVGQVPQKGHRADQQVCASAAHDEKWRNGAPNREKLKGESGEGTEGKSKVQRPESKVGAIETLKSGRYR